MKRFNNLSIYRIIAALCVLQFHVFYLTYARAIPCEMLLSKGVQGLTALSGFLYSQKLIKDVKKFYLGSLIKLLIPAAVVLTFILLWDVVFMAATHNWDFIAAFTMHRAYGGRLITSVDNYYYLGYITICYLATPLLQRDDAWKWVAASGIIAIEVAVGFVLGPAMIATSYVIGYFVGKKLFKAYTDTEQKFSVPILLITTGVLVVSLGVYIVCINFPFGGNYFLDHLYNLNNNVMMTIFGTATFFFVAIALKFLNKYNQPKLFKFTDKISFPIYLLNQAFMCGGTDITRYVEPIWLQNILIFVCTISAAVLIQIVCDMIMNAINNRKNKKQETQTA